MRQILVDHARRRQAGKRAHRELSLEETVSSAHERSADLIALDDALNALEKLDARKCKAVELRYFGGLSTWRRPRRHWMFPRSRSVVT